MSLSSYRRIVVHCGIHKTGSSYIQSLLQNNHEVLANHGVHFPTIGRDGNHSIIAVNYRSGDDIENHFNKHVSLESPCTTLLLSGEEFSRQILRNGFLEAFLQAAGDASVEFLFYLRRVDHLRESVYAESVKNKLFGDIAESKFQFDFHATVIPFIDAVGRDKVILRPYNPAKWLDGSYPRDFFHSIGLERVLDRLQLPESSRVNASLSRQETFLLSRLKERDTKVAMLKYFSVAPMRPTGDPTKFFMSPMERQRFRMAHADSARRLGELFGISDFQDFLGTEETASDAQWQPFIPDWEYMFAYLAAFADTHIENPKSGR